MQCPWCARTRRPPQPLPPLPSAAHQSRSSALPRAVRSKFTHYLKHPVVTVFLCLSKEAMAAQTCAGSSLAFADVVRVRGAGCWVASGLARPARAVLQRAVAGCPTDARELPFSPGLQNKGGASSMEVFDALNPTLPSCPLHLRAGHLCAHQPGRGAPRAPRACACAFARAYACPAGAPRC